MTEGKDLNTDAWANLLTGMGRVQRDKRMSTEFGTLTSLSNATLDNLYQGDWLIARACDRPSSEMTRKWLEIKAAEQKDEAQKVGSVMKKLGAKQAFKRANTWARLHGGALIILGIDDGQEMSEPVDEARIRDIEYLRVLDRWDVSVGDRYGSDEKPGMVGEPSLYSVNTAVVDKSRGGIMPKVHETRTLRFDGVDTPLRLRIQNDMWNYGIVHRIYSVVRDFANTWGGAAHLMTDFAQAVFKMKDLRKMLAEDGENLVIRRLVLLDMARSIARLVPLDAESEDFERKTTPITGLSDILDRFAEQVAGAVEMPVSVLFGKATPGIGDTGNSQLQQWHEHLANEQEIQVVPQAERLARYLFLSREGPTRGREPESWSVDPLPLQEMSEKDQVELHKKQAETDKIMIDSAVLSPGEVRESRYGGDEYTINTTLDESVTELLKSDPAADAAAAEPEPEPVADPKPEGEPEGDKPQDTAMTGGQVKALADVLVAYNKKDLTKEQAAGVISIGFLVEPQRAAVLVGEREEKPQPPAPPPGFQPGQPPQPPRPQPPQPPQPPEPEPPRQDADMRHDRIEKRGDKYVVLSEAGKVLGTHDTEKAAKDQLAAIEAAKQRR